MEFSEEITEERLLAEILKDMCTFAFENGMIVDDSVTVTDLFDTTHDTVMIQFLRETQKTQGISKKSGKYECRI